VDIYFATDMVLATTNGSRALSKIEIQPAASLPGEHWVTVVQRLNDTSAQTRFPVRTNWAERVSLPTVNASTLMRNVLTPTK
jgi:hypothetical protein